MLLLVRFLAEGYEGSPEDWMLTEKMKLCTSTALPAFVAI